MTKLKRLLVKCSEQTIPNGGTAESFNNCLNDLGRWVFSLYNNGKLEIGDGSAKLVCMNEHMGINEFVKEFGELAFSHGYWNNRDRSFGELIAACHCDLSKVLEEAYTGYHPSYTYYRRDSDPKGVPAELANVIIRIFVICHHYEIDIEKILNEKLENNKKKKCWYSKKKM